MRAQSTSLGALKFVFLLPFDVCQGLLGIGNTRGAVGGDGVGFGCKSLFFVEGLARAGFWPVPVRVVRDCVYVDCQKWCARGGWNEK